MLARLLDLARSWWRDARTLEGQGLAGALLIYLSFTIASLALVPQFRPFDELRNVSYAFEVARGRLPEIPDDLPHDVLGTRQRSSDFHASAQHPPLYYALVGAPIRLAVAQGNLELGVVLARLMTLCFGLGAMIYVFRLGRLLAPDLPSLAIVGTSMFASLPVVTNTFSIVYNDALATLAGAGMLHASLSILRYGPTRQRLVKAAIWMAVASLTRFAAVLMDAVGMLAVFLAAFVHDPPPFKKQLELAVRRCLPLLGAVLLASGWFYARNYLLYGDVTGAKLLFSMLDRPVRGNPIVFALSPSYWLELHDIIWGHMVGGGRYMGGTGVVLARTLSVLSIGGVVVAAVRFRGAIRARFGRAELALILVLVLVFFGVCAPALAFHAKGGTLMARYCVPAAWLPCLFAAVGYAGFKRPFASQAFLCVYVLLALLTYELYALDLLNSARARDFSLVLGMTREGFAGSALFCFVLAGVASGLALTLNAVASLHRRLDQTGPA